MSLLIALWAAPAAMGFALMFNVRIRALPLVAAIAVLAKVISLEGQHMGLELAAADFIAAFVVGAIAYTIAPKLGEASPVFAFAPVIPLVPGSLIYHSFVLWMTSASSANAHGNAELAQVADTGLTAAAIVLALCLGAISPMLLMPRARTSED